jgi:hypothetical protein
MPCSPRTARLLLRDGKAKVIKRTPFTIKLLIGVKGYTQPLTMGIDPGSKNIGSAVRDEKNRAVYLSEIEQRTDVHKNMDQRKMYRRTRRNRKTRYRKPRFLNRKNSTKTNRYPPTMESMYAAIVREIQFACSILPIVHLYIEIGKFDIVALTDPSVLTNPSKYQKGPAYGFHNVKAYVLNRDNYTCQYCKNKRKDPKLHCHHIITRKKESGTDRAANLIVLCKLCHDDLHAGKISLTKKHINTTLKHATQMNVLSSMINKRLGDCGFEKTYGYIAKALREYFNFPKSHTFDALFGSIRGDIKPTFLVDRIIEKKCVPKGDYKQTCGSRSEKKLPTGKIQGFRNFDKVL